MTGRTGSPRERERLAKLVEIAGNLPEIDVSITGQHRSFRVRGKTFAWYLRDHHGDGIVSLCCKSTLERQRELVAADPEAYYAAAYVGSKGWVALRLDLPRLDWGRVTDLLFDAYRRQAPRRLGDHVG